MVQRERRALPIRVEPLWARIDANRVRIALFVVLFVTGSAVLLEASMVVLPGSLLSLLATDTRAYFGVLGVVVAASFALLLAVGALIAAVQLANAEDWVRARFRGRDLTDAEAPGLVRAVADMALAAGLPEVPRIIVIDAERDSVNALAVGTTRKRALIGVTPGFLTALDEAEQRAVVATLTARIIAGDIMFGTALAALMGPIKAIRRINAGAGGVASGLADAGCSDPGCSGCSDGCSGCGDLSDLDSGGCGGLIAVVVFLVVVAVITYVAVVTSAWIVTWWGRALHRTAYEKADAEGMLLLKDPGPMLRALEKAAKSSNVVADGDASYDSIFYIATSGTPRVERVERRRHARLRGVLGTEGLAARELD
jgi:Zn-dependent protease with chaperone function